MSLLVLSGSDVDTVASTLSPDDLQLLMAQVFIRLSDSSAREGSVVMPPRISIPTAHHTALFMPARLGLHLQEPPPSHAAQASTRLGDTAIKVVCVPRQNDSRGLPATTLILDEETGVAKAVVNARKLTALRNSAGSLLSTSLVGPSKPQTLVAFGAGQQIESHLDLHIRHFPSITQCIVVNRTANNRAISLREKLISRFSHVQISLLASNTSNISSSDRGSQHDNESSRIQLAVKSADIIICATSSTTPLFPSSWVKNGTHIILIGSYTPSMREVDKSLVQRAIGSFKSLDGENSASNFPVLLVDSREACSHEAGELIDAGVSPEQMTELGQLIPKDENGNLALKSFYKLLDAEKPRVSEDLYDGPITMFKSVGIGLQDVAIATAIVDKSFSLEKKIGTIIIDYDTKW
ncbi:hypothetical protein GALMADRAFT_228656 [Galerina marginata CBS 339.88]|uniref:Ornithine cyclodeaminase n=1 Tax=Galerina marginata (strain CBS 339.88) TaxID=685588 RepID=A0A067SZ87_GALM3|nr:hypothetical protein GALMADRAFT_228656 [Galerina marginata CBS 339.88]